MHDERRRLRIESNRIEPSLARLAAVSPRTLDLWARMPRRKRVAARVRLFLTYGIRGRMVVRDDTPERRVMFAVKR